MQGFYELTRDKNLCTKSWRKENNEFLAHFHSTIELMYVEEGVLCAYQNGVSTLVPAGHLIVNSSYMVHSCYTPDYSRITIATIPLTTIPSLRGILSQHSFAKGIVDTRGMKECPRIMRMMSDPYNSGNIRFVNCLGEALLSLLIEKIGLKNNEADAESDFIKRVLTYIEAHASEPLNVTSVAAAFGYSTGRFSHIFNRCIGCSFTKYLNSLRCRKAKTLLDMGGIPLIDVAAASGFTSIRSFHRVYKEFTGSTPRSQAI